MSSSESQNKTWELSLYELHRTPQETITDGTEIAVSPRSLHNELMCPICLDMLKKTHTTKECLHRFCSDCIVTALRSGNKECPTCRKKLVSKRSLRPDPNFDLLISKIYPSRDEYEAHQERVLAKLNKSQSQAALVMSINDGIKMQSQARSLKRKNLDETRAELVCDENSMNSNSNTNPPSVRSTPSPVPSNISSISKNTSITKRTQSILTSERSEESDTSEARTEAEFSLESEPEELTNNSEVELVFRPHPTEMTAEILTLLGNHAVRYLKTYVVATVEHLSKYLAMRMTLDLDAELHETYRLSFCIYISPVPGQYVCLTGLQTLKQILEKYWKVNKPLELFYSWKKS